MLHWRTLVDIDDDTVNKLYSSPHFTVKMYLDYLDDSLDKIECMRLSNGSWERCLPVCKMPLIKDSTTVTHFTVIEERTSYGGKYIEFHTVQIIESSVVIGSQRYTTQHIFNVTLVNPKPREDAGGLSREYVLRIPSVS